MATGTATRARGIDAQPLPAAARLTIAAQRACRHRSVLHYLFTADVTTARRLMALSPHTSSLTAFVTATVARAAAETPAVHAYRDWRGRLITHRHVDVMVLMEAPQGDEREVLRHLVRDADTRDIAALRAELRLTPGSSTTADPYGLPHLPAVPGLARAAYTVLNRSVRLRQRVGTVTVTFTGLDDIGEVFALPAPALTPLQVTIGGTRSHPHQTGTFIDQHEVLDLSLSFDGEIVSAQEAARFARRLSSGIEHADVLQAEAFADWPVAMATSGDYRP
jgi:hypothetical protein